MVHFNIFRTACFARFLFKNTSPDINSGIGSSIALKSLRFGKNVYSSMSSHAVGMAGMAIALIFSSLFSALTKGIFHRDSLNKIVTVELL